MAALGMAVDRVKGSGINGAVGSGSPPPSCLCRCWWWQRELTKAATKDRREKISTGEINPNIQTASYLGNVVLGEFYKQYKALPPNGRATAITRFWRLFRHIQLERELEGRRLARRGVEEEGKKR